MKHFFLDKSNELVECELEKDSPYKRIIKFKEGTKKGKITAIHPAGVAWGLRYPRLFKSETKPTEVFVYKGRTLVNNFSGNNAFAAIPKVNDHYNFLPFTADVIDCVNLKENVLLTGGAGVGKTSNICQLAARIKQPVVRINFNGETRMSDLIGKTQVVNGETRWVDGVLPTAMRNGYWLLLDEIDAGDPAILALLHPVLESDPCLVLKENAGEVIFPHENFRIFATANSIGAMQDKASSFAGTNQMNEAFLDRWQVIMVGNLPEKDEIKVVKAEAPGIKSRFAKKIVQFANKIRNQSEESGEIVAEGFSTRKVISWSKRTALLRNPIAAAKKTWLDKIPLSEQEVVLKILETHFGSGNKIKKEKTSNLKATTKKTGKRGRPRKLS